jgi:hypothetical protein
MKGKDDNCTETDKVLNFLKRKYPIDVCKRVFLGYAKTLKTFSPKRHAVTKIRIAQIMTENEIKQPEGHVRTLPLPSFTQSLIHYLRDF